MYLNAPNKLGLNVHEVLSILMSTVKLLAIMEAFLVYCPYHYHIKLGSFEGSILARIMIEGKFNLHIAYCIIGETGASWHSVFSNQQTPRFNDY